MKIDGKLPKIYWKDGQKLTEIKSENQYILNIFYSGTDYYVESVVALTE